MTFILANSSIGGKTIGYINTHINEEITINELTKHFFYNKTYLMKKFKKETGNTISEYINKKRILESINELINTDDKILKIALKNGFNSAEYYSEMFLRYIGCSPTTFKKILENKFIGDIDVKQIRKNFDNLSQEILNLEPEKQKVLKKERNK